MAINCHEPGSAVSRDQDRTCEDGLRVQAEVPDTGARDTPLVSPARGCLMFRYTRTSVRVLRAYDRDRLSFAAELRFVYDCHGR